MLSMIAEGDDNDRHLTKTHLLSSNHILRYVPLQLSTGTEHSKHSRRGVVDRTLARMTNCVG